MDHEEAYHMQVDSDNLTISLKEQEDRFTLSESDYYGLNVPTLNINNDEDAKRWEELMAEEAESEVAVVKMPVKTLSQKEWNELFVKGKWEELSPQKSQSEMIIIPQRTLSQKALDVKLKDTPILQKTEWSDCDSDGLFSDDEDEIDLMDYINPITNRKRVKIVDSDEEDDNKLVQLKPKVAVDLTKEVAKAKADLEGTEDESKDKKDRVVMRWCFTMNNPTVSGNDLAEKLKATDNVKGFVFQLEEGANGTEHFQGYIEFKKQQRMSAAKKLLGENPHMEAANGDKESNLKYCTKEEGRKEGPWIWGTCTEEMGPGKRNDLNDFAMMIEEYGGITDEVMQAFPGHALQFRRQAKERTEEIVMKLAKEKEKAWWMEQKRLKDAGLPYLTQRQMKCIMLFGPTAVGKTTHVKLETLGMGEDLYEKAGNNKWYPGYAGEKHMLVDEMTTGFCEKDIRNFNKMTNLGMNVQEVKGSHVLLDVETAWFTTNKHPLHIWDEVKESGTYKAFIRRFDEVHWWNDQKKLVILKNPGSKDDADDEAQWKKDYTRWMSFWNGKQLDDEHRTIVPGQEVKNYFTFGCNQPQTNIVDMLMF